MSQLFGVALTGTGSCLPARVVPNDAFAETLNLDTSDEWIRTRTGIRERRFAGAGETSASLGATGTPWPPPASTRRPST
jgi:3-oxoacyl-[acyl-carrier-protein] synthase-3